MLYPGKFPVSLWRLGLSAVVTLLPLVSCNPTGAERDTVSSETEPSPNVRQVDHETAGPLREDPDLPSEYAVQAVSLDFYGLVFDLPPEWTLVEELRNECAEAISAGEKAACAWYVLHAGQSARVLIRPDCGYADAGPVECPEDAVNLLENEDGSGLLRFLAEDGTYRYTTVGTAAAVSIDGSTVEMQVCYSPPVMGIPAADPELTAQIIVEIEDGVDPEDVLSMVDGILLSVQKEP